MTLSAGVPQGSVLGPTLWNVLYDDVLRLAFPPGVEATAYADDLAITIVADEIFDLNRKASFALGEIATWMQDHHLQLAPQKTEAVILKGPYKRDTINIELMGQTVSIKREARYLGVTIDTQGHFGKHVLQIIKKAERRATAMNRLMPNIGGPGYHRRRLLWGVIQSTILYAAPVWHRATRIVRYRNLLCRTQRKVLLRVGMAYRTVSALAIQVITGTPPMDLLIEERARRWAYREELPPNNNEARNETITKWQERWERNDQHAQWTKRLIPEIEPWLRCGYRRTNYFLTQFTTGHGSFRTYTKRIAKDTTDACRYCGETDSPEHTVFSCGRWDRNRILRWGEWRNTLTPDNIIGCMLSGKKNWEVIAGGIMDIMRSKEAEERAFQSRALIQERVFM